MAAHPVPTIAAPTTAPPDLLALELTGRCNLACSHCFAESGVHGTHGTMTVADWEAVIDDAAALGTRMVQLIGGEPTQHPGFAKLLEYTLAAGLQVEVYSNLVTISQGLWELLARPGVRLATSYYSDLAAEHDAITGRVGSHAHTTANIQTALARGIPLRVGMVAIHPGQRVEPARTYLRSLGVTHVRVDHERAVGRAARGRVFSPAALCGRCGHGRAAVLPTGDVTPCVLARALPAGNVLEQQLGTIMQSEAWRQNVATIPPLRSATGCQPSDSNDCDPDGTGTCDPTWDNG